MDQLRQLEEEFAGQKSNADLYAQLQQAYESSGHWLEAARLREHHSSVLSDDQRAAQLLREAAIIYARFGQDEKEAEVLTKMMERHGGDEKCRERLRTLCAQRERWDELLHLLVEESEQLADNERAPRRRAELELQAGNIWEEKVFSLERAVVHYERAHRTDPTDVTPMRAARRIFQSVAGWSEAAALFQLEIEQTADVKERSELFLNLGRLQRDKMLDLVGAAASLTEASQLRPSDEAISLELAELYLLPKWPEEEGHEKAATILLQLAQRRYAHDNREGAIELLQRLLKVQPENETAFQRLERIFEETARWDDLTNLYAERVSQLKDKDRFAMTKRRADIFERKLGDRKRARECYLQLFEYDPHNQQIANKLLDLHQGDEDLDKRVEVQQKILDHTRDLENRLRLQLELAEIYREQLDDKEAAALMVHETLKADPRNRKALTAYQEYFRQKKEFGPLVELLRYAAQSAQSAKAPAVEVCGYLEEAAELSVRELGDIEGAIEAWQQMESIHPDHQRVTEMLGRLSAKYHLQQNAVRKLEQELLQARAPMLRLQALRHMAEFFFEKKVDPIRTINVLEELTQQAPNDENAWRMLSSLYEKQNEKQKLAKALKQQLTYVGAKEDRLPLLKRIADLYEDSWAQPKEAIEVYRELFELQPPDSSLLDKMEKVLKDVDDFQELARLLNQRAQNSRSLGDKLEAFKRLAEVYEREIDNPGRAADCWEEYLSVEKNGRVAIEALLRLYPKLGRYEKMLELVHTQLAQCNETDKEKAAEEKIERSSLLSALLTIGEQRSELASSALEIWELFSSIDEADDESLEILIHLYTQTNRFPELERAYAKKVSRSQDREDRLIQTLKRADILEDKLQDQAAARQVYQQILHDIAPADHDVHQRLKDLALRRQDYVQLCSLIEREIFLIPSDSPERLSLALNVARIWLEDVHDLHRAILAYEHVLALEPSNENALFALRTLYKETKQPQRLCNLVPLFFSSSRDAEERKALLLDIASFYQTVFEDPRAAFGWYRRCFNLFPYEQQCMQAMQRLAEENDLWPDLCDALLEARQASSDDPATYLDYTRALVTLQEEKFSNFALAFQYLADAVNVIPDTQLLLAELMRLAELSGKHEMMDEIFHHLLEQADDLPSRVALLKQRAHLHENKMGNPSAALDDLLELYSLAPDEEGLIERIENLCQTASRWSDGIKLCEHRLREAHDDQEALSIIFHLAEIWEQRLNEQQKAFLVLLSAIPLQPEYPSLIDELWRLATSLSAKGAVERDGGTQELLLDDAEEIDEEMPDASKPDLPESFFGYTQPIPQIHADDLSHTRSKFPSSKTIVDHPPKPQTRWPWEKITRAYLSLPHTSDAELLTHKLRIARIWTHGAMDADRAFAIFNEIPASQIITPQVQQQIDEQIEHFRAPERAIALYEEAIERATDAQEIKYLHQRIATLLLDIGKIDESLAHYQAIRQVDPDDEQANDKLVALYQQLELWTQLAQLRREHLDSSLALTDRSFRRQLLEELVDLHQNRLGQLEIALEYQKQLAELTDHEEIVLDQLIFLQENLRHWSPLAQSLRLIIDKTADQTKRVNSLLRLASLMENELELPGQAIELYRQVGTDEPLNQTAILALERLYETHDHPAELIDVLKLRIALAESNPSEARDLLLKLAALQERQELINDARTSLEQARIINGLDMEVSNLLSSFLVRHGLAQAATALLSEQIETLREREATVDEQIAVYCQQAEIYERLLNDAPSAQAALEQARVLAPQNDFLLRTLAAFYLNHEQWAEFVITQDALAQTLANLAPLEAAAALLTAAQISNEKLQDTEGAIARYEQALKFDENSLTAVNALLALPITSQKREEELLHSQARLSESVDEKSYVFTQLAKKILERSGPLEESSNLLQAAIAMQPQNMTAVQILSQLFVEHSRWAEAAQVLQNFLSNVVTPKQEMAELYHRLGFVLEWLQQPELAQQAYEDALRLNPQHLIYRIAAGLNRYRGQQMREAWRLLVDISTHPDLTKNPAAAIDGLYALGQCEIQLQRRADALRTFTQLLELEPQHILALQEMARLAREQKDWPQTATMLTRLAEAATDPREKLLVLHSLGIVQRDHLNDPAKAAEAFSALLPLLDDEAGRLEILPQIIPLLREQKQHQAAAKAAHMLTEIVEDLREKINLLQIAAFEYETAGLTDNAIAMWQRAVELAPNSLQALDGYSRLLVASGKYQEVTSLLANISIDAAAFPENERPLWANLHLRIGEAHRQFGDLEKTIVHWENALTLIDDLSTRKMLAEIYAHFPGYEMGSLANHRQIVNKDPAHVPSLCALADAHEAINAYRAQTFYQILQVMNALTSRGETFLRENPIPQIEVDVGYPGAMSIEERLSLLQPPGIDSVITQSLSLLWEAAPVTLARKLEEYQLSEENRVSPADQTNLSQVFSAVSRALGVKQIALYLSPKGGMGTVDFRVLPVAPPAIVVSAQSAASYSVTELCFLLGRAIEQSLPAFVWASSFEKDDFQTLIDAMLRAFHPQHMRLRMQNADEPIAQLASRLRQAVPFKAAQRIGELLRAESKLESVTATNWQQSTYLHANRVGLLMCGDLATAFRLIIEENPDFTNSTVEELLQQSLAIHDLFSFAVSDQYFFGRIKLGLAQG